MKTRKERRSEAKLNGIAFEPQYNGKTPVDYKEFYGKGNERFNSKFITIKKAK